MTAWADVHKAEQAAREKEQVQKPMSNAAAAESQSVVPESTTAEVRQEVPVSQ